MTHDFASLFDGPAPRGGLRGDPYLWDAMRDALRGEPLPDSLAALDARIGALYRDWTGQPLSATAYACVAEFAHGGMSSGRIYPPFWNDIALPLLRARWVALTNRAS